MPKVITSPVKHWPGTVTLFDPLTLPQAEAIDETRHVFAEYKEGDRVTLFLFDKPCIPTILACVEKWELKDFPASPTLEAFPMSPEKSRHQLVKWLWDEIKAVYEEEADTPNE